MFLEAGIGAHGLWSISRGLSRGLGDASAYKRMMDAADAPRRSDLDGRGNLSLDALVEFVTWFCDVALDQVRFMTELFGLANLHDRLQRYIEDRLGLPAEASSIALEVLRRGELPRGQAGRVSGRADRSARLLLSRLVDARLLVSDTPKSAVRLSFSVESADHLFPRLFPAQAA
jgi:Fic family protein